MNNMMETHINVMPVNRQHEKQWQRKSFESLSINKNLFTDICQSSSIFIFLTIIAIIQISQVIVGWRYSDACPINQLIPHYLIVAGVVGLLLIILISITQLMIRTVARKMFDDVIDTANSNRAASLVGCGVCSIMCINFSLFVFLIGWFIAGWIWVIEVWHRVQYHRSDRDDYCHPLLYQFAFSLLSLITTFKMIFFCFACRNTCNKVENIARKESLPAENS